MIQTGTNLRPLRALIWRVCFTFIAILAASQGGAVEPPSSKPRPSVDLYMFIGEWPVWFGSTIRYTVYQTTRVEARVIGVTGEIILVLQEGEKQPGQYTLPFDGTYGGSPLAGYYTFELYFGDEYAAKYQMVALPITQPL